MTYDQRQAKGKILCQKLVEHVGRLAPEGIGRWNRAWEIVDTPSAEFMALLTAWEIDPSDMTMERVSAAYDLVLAAWEEAGRAFERETAL